MDNLHGGGNVDSEAPRPPRKNGTGTAGLPGNVISFILCPFTPPIPLTAGRDTCRSKRYFDTIIYVSICLDWSCLD